MTAGPHIKRDMRQLFALVMALALPLAAQEAQAPKQDDSPLVAASKRANRKGKKAANVITNDMVRQAGSGAPRVTTTAVQAPVPVIPPATGTPEMHAIAERDAERRKLAEQEASKKETDEKKARLALMRAAAAEGELYHDSELDPDELVEATEAAAQQKPPRG